MWSAQRNPGICVGRWLKRQELDIDALHKCLEYACRGASPTADAVSADKGVAATSPDLAHVLKIVRSELLAIDPERILGIAVEPVVPSALKTAVTKVAAKDRPELFAISPKAAALLKKKTKVTRKPKKGSSSN